MDYVIKSSTTKHIIHLRKALKFNKIFSNIDNSVEHLCGPVFTLDFWVQMLFRELGERQRMQIVLFH